MGSAGAQTDFPAQNFLPWWDELGHTLDRRPHMILSIDIHWTGNITRYLAYTYTKQVTSQGT